MSKQNPAKPQLRIEAKHIGPIMQINAELSSNKQNLIFAKNGVGKSFIARALRHLGGRVNTKHADEELPKLLVSQEAEGSKGYFKLFEDGNKIGGIEMGTEVSPVLIRSEPKYIFHVFSQDYVDEEIRNKLDDLDGEITHEIIIGGENVELDELKTTIIEKKTSYDELRAEITNTFTTRKGILKTNFGINAGLGAYKDLSSDVFLGSTPFSNIEGISNLESLLTDYNKFKSLPTDPSIPKKVDFNFVFDFDAVLTELEKITSLSTVEESIKEKIKEKPDFFEHALKKLNDDKEHCPLCTQELNVIGLNAIEAYREYFKDEEAQHISLINKILTDIDNIFSNVAKARRDFQASKTDFDKLKDYFPSMDSKNFHGITDALDELEKYFGNLQKNLRDKKQQLDQKMEAPNFDNTIIQNIKTSLEGNDKLIDSLVGLVINSAKERRDLQSSACEAFLNEFAKTRSVQIDEFRKLKAEEGVLQNKLDALSQKYEGKASARERVAKTFSIMLERFFRDKYSFDADNFKVRHNNREMQRGGERTLSDGEKSVMAFCYFIAQIHLRVESINDYQNLYFVFDDPVTSLSLDYVYTIVTSLKQLRISKDGDVSVNGQSDWHKPKMLILTHNYYFCNLASSHNVVHVSGLFQLISGQSAHTLESQEAFATPHALHLRDVHQISQGKKPSHTTSNSIRSVIETIGKFFYPDNKDLNQILRLWKDRHGIEIKNILILHDLSHGGKIEEASSFEDDIKAAADEVIEMVRKLVPGQLEKLEGS
ncbi:MAG: AAA family ATPase [Gammaproteobacteria bacterium AqS3]|nr:AAA family ATPase [Gammaproteobacteria bacterium AqS3]